VYHVNDPAAAATANWQIAASGELTIEDGSPVFLFTASGTSTISVMRLSYDLPASDTNP
jgi:hypothetical protein